MAASCMSVAVGRLRLFLRKVTLTASYVPCSCYEVEVVTRRAC